MNRLKALMLKNIYIAKDVSEAERNQDGIKVRNNWELMEGDAGLIGQIEKDKIVPVERRDSRFGFESGKCGMMCKEKIETMRNVEMGSRNRDYLG